MSRTKIEVFTDKISREEAEQMGSEYARITSELKKIEAKMEADINKIRDKHQAQIVLLNETREDLATRLKHFADTNPELFSLRKSIDFVHCVLGFRTATPSLATQKGFTWASVVAVLNELAPDFVRTKQEVDKETLLARRNDEGMDANFRKWGISVKQGESFFVEAKEEKIAA